MLTKRAPIGPRGSSTAEECQLSMRDKIVPCWGPATCPVASMVERQLNLSRDQSIPIARKTDEDIVSAINRALIYQQALVHIWIINMRRNAKGTITAITHQNATAEMALLYQDSMIMAAKSVPKGIIVVEGNESCEKQKNPHHPTSEIYGQWH